MSKPSPNTFQFPLNLRLQYQQLMTSQASFTKKLTGAELTRLTDLYARLKSAWQANRIDELKHTIEERSSEFRQIQREIASDCETFKRATREQSTLNFQTRLNALKIKKRSWSSDINQRKQSLTETEIDWPGEKQAIFNVGVNSLNGLRTKLAGLRDALRNLVSGDQQFNSDKTRLAAKQDELTSKSRQLTEKLLRLTEQQQQLTSDEAPYQTAMTEQRLRLLRSLTENRQTLSLRLTQQQSDSESMLSRLKSEFEATTRGTEQRLLQQLSSEMAGEHPEWPDEFRTYLVQGDLYSLSNRKNAVAQACNELERG